MKSRNCLFRTTFTALCVLVLLSQPVSAKSLEPAAPASAGPSATPVAADDGYSTGEDSTLSVPANGVLGNDTDDDGDSLSAVLVASTSHGTLSLNSDGSFTYDPNPNYDGADSFTYQAEAAGEQSNTATVTIDVQAANDAPTADDESYTINEDQALNVSAPGVLTGDTDIDGDALTAVLENGPAHGTLNLQGDGAFDYTPSANYSGPDSFTYRASDGTTTSNIATVSIDVQAVNDAPAADDEAYTTNEDQALNVSAPGVLDGDTDIENDVLTAQLANPPANGSVTLNSDGSFDYAPNPNFNGSDFFTYVADDGQASSAAARVDITIDPVPDSPIAENDSYSTHEDVNLFKVPVPGVLANDSDSDGDPMTPTLIIGPANGSLTLNADGSFDYTPDLNFNGTDNFTYQTESAGEQSAPATVTLDVTPVNDAPVAGDDQYSANRGVPLTIPSPGILVNDTDVDNAPAPLTAVNPSQPGHGTLVLNTNGSFVYTPVSSFTGVDSFTYRARDNAGGHSNLATVAITVNFSNSAPVAVNDGPYTLDEDDAGFGAPAEIGVLKNDTDLENDALTAVLVNGASHGVVILYANGSFSYTPEKDFFGSDSFTYQARDPYNQSNQTATVSLIVKNVNDAPVAQDNTYSVNQDTPLVVATPGVLTNDIDIDGPRLEATKVSDPTQGALNFNSNGSFTYTPPAGYVGTVTFQYRAYDGSLESGMATVTVTVRDTVQPSLQWVSPVTTGNRFDAGDLIVNLVVAADDNVGVTRVSFYRWDAMNERWVDILNDTTAPFSVSLDTALLHGGWNQIFAKAYDKQGNESARQHIWIYHQHFTYLPFMVLQ